MSAAKTLPKFSTGETVRVIAPVDPRIHGYIGPIQSCEYRAGGTPFVYSTDDDKTSVEGWWYSFDGSWAAHENYLRKFDPPSDDSFEKMMHKLQNLSTKLAEITTPFGNKNA